MQAPRVLLLKHVCDVCTSMRVYANNIRFNSEYRCITYVYKTIEKRVFDYTPKGVIFEKST